MSILKFENRTPRDIQGMYDYMIDENKTNESLIFGLGVSPLNTVAEMKFVQYVYGRYNLMHKYKQVFNQSDFVAVNIQFGRIQNGMSEVVNEGIVGVVGLGSVDDDCLQILVPALRLAEEFAQSAFAVDRIGSESFDEFFGNVFVNVVGVGMAEVIVQSRPDVVAGEFLEFVHIKDLRK